MSWTSRGKMIHWNRIVSRYFFTRYRIVGLVSRYLTIRPKVQFPKKMIARTYFKTIFITNYKDLKCYWNALSTYMKTGAPYTGIVTQEWTSEMVLNLFFKSIKNFKLWLLHENTSITAIRIVSKGDCIVTVLSTSRLMNLSVYARGQTRLEWDLK